jgi:hypothetical protein
MGSYELLSIDHSCRHQRRSFREIKTHPFRTVAFALLRKLLASTTIGAGEM